MEQVRFNYKEKSTQVSIFLGLAKTLNDARQVIIDKIDDMDLLVDGDFYFGDDKI